MCLCLRLCLYQNPDQDQDKYKQMQIGVLKMNLGDGNNSEHSLSLRVCLFIFYFLVFNSIPEILFLEFLFQKIVLCMSGCTFSCLSCLVLLLSCLGVLSCPVLSCLALSCLAALSCLGVVPVLSCPVLCVGLSMMMEVSPVKPMFSRSLIAFGCLSEGRRQNTTRQE